MDAQVTRLENLDKWLLVKITEERSFARVSLWRIKHQPLGPLLPPAKSIVGFSRRGYWS
jgi:hypothetical protein